jgi:catechol 2,3-dioxygenase-like lactoylglutathione lyase family enzyme
MSSLELDHVAISVADARRSRQFYAEVLGLPLVSAMSGDDWDGHPWLLMFFKLDDGRMVALTTFAGVVAEPKSGLPADARHYALATDDLEAWKKKLAQHKIAVREEDHGAQRSLFIEDPDHTVWEITSPASATAFEEDPSEAQHIVERWIAGIEGH